MFEIEDTGVIKDPRGVPRTRAEMKWASETGYIIPAFRDGKITVDKVLDHADVVLEWYVPSVEAIEFINFIRLVLGEEPENDNPPAHYFLIDCIFRSKNVRPYFEVRNIDLEVTDDRIVVLCTREFAKSVLIGTMLVLYMAATGKLPGFGSVNYALYVSDSMRNNVKTTMETIGAVYKESEYLRNIFEDATTNQDEISFVRKPTSKRDLALYNEYVNIRGMKENEVPGRMKRTFSMKGIGASTGGRGSRDALFRPEIAIFDDMIGNEQDANSETILENIESTIESDVLKALSNNGNFAILIGTPYNKKDPVYARIEEGSWTPIVFPKAEVMNEDVTAENFRGVWPDRHSFKQCRKDYLRAKRSSESGNKTPMRSLMQEYYLRISSDDDRMIPDHLIQWYSRSDIIANPNRYRWYMTTDFTSGGADGKDYSGIALWAVSWSGDWFLVQLSLRRLSLEDQYEMVFGMARELLREVSYLEVGVEVDGNQAVHIYALKERMTKENVFFSFAKQKGATSKTAQGIRSRTEGGNKHWRFRMMLPMFENHKIWFPRELEHTADMSELMEELRYVNYGGFGSTRDDGADLISMIGMMKVNLPHKDEGADSVKKVGMKRSLMNEKIWGKKMQEDDEGTAYDSYA